MEQLPNGQQRGGVDMITRGQPIQKSQLDELAVLANAKLPIRYRINGLLPDGDPVALPVNEATRAQFVNYYADQTRPQKAFEFEATNWRDELLRIRVNLRDWIEGIGTYQTGWRPGSEIMVSSYWPTIASGSPGLIQVANIKNLQTLLHYYHTSAAVTFMLRTTGEADSTIPALREQATNVIATDTVYRYTITIPDLTGKRSSVFASDNSGVYFIKAAYHAPNMNPFSTATPLTHYDERITRFAPIRHRALNPYSELPAPYPPAEINYEQQGDLSGQTIPVSYTQHYDGLAEYFYGLAPDIRGPKSPSASSYFRIPTYPIRKRADGAYEPFANEAISRNDYSLVIRHGMIDSVTVSRTTSTAAETVRIGNFIGGNFREIHSETLSIGERSKTFYPSLLVFADAPLYYDAPETFNVMPTFVGKETFGDALQVDVKWPIHSCYYNDTEALLNALP